jgi:hypothetical protein
MSAGSLPSKQESRSQDHPSYPLDAPYAYRLFGLNLRSEIPFEELTQDAISTSPPPDITLFQGDIEECLQGAHTKLPFMQFSETAAQVHVQGMARYRVSNGREIVFDPGPARTDPQPHSPGDLKAHLLGSAMGILIHQRADLPLHVSLSESPSGVIAFTGESGAGKSTAAAWLWRTHDWPLLSDDVAVVKAHSDPISLRFGPPRIKLWNDALVKMRIDPNRLKRDTAREQKFHLASKRSKTERQTKRLAALVLLSKTQNREPFLERVRGAEAFTVAMSAVYRPRIGNFIRGQHAIAADIAKLINEIEIYRFHRPWDLDRLDQSLKPIIELFGHQK